MKPVQTVKAVYHLLSQMNSLLAFTHLQSLHSPLVLGQTHDSFPLVLSGSLDLHEGATSGNSSASNLFQNASVLYPSQKNVC